MVQAIKRDEVYIEPEGIYVETQQPERRSRKPPLLLVHGALTGSWLWSSFGAYFAERGWEAHAMNLRGHYTSDLAELDETSMGRLLRRYRSRGAASRTAAGRYRLGDRCPGGDDLRVAQPGARLGAARPFGAGGRGAATS